MQRHLKEPISKESVHAISPCLWVQEGEYLSSMGGPCCRGFGCWGSCPILRTALSTL